MCLWRSCSRPAASPAPRPARSRAYADTAEEQLAVWEKLSGAMVLSMSHVDWLMVASGHTNPGTVSSFAEVVQQHRDRLEENSGAWLIDGLLLLGKLWASSKCDYYALWIFLSFSIILRDPA